MKTDEELRAMLDGAIKGPWICLARSGALFVKEVAYMDDPETPHVARVFWNKETARLIAAAPDLAAEVLRLRAIIEGVADDLSSRVTDFPKHTCSDIDRVIREIKPVAAAARAKMREDEFADDVDTLLNSLPDDLDDLRGYNSQLRESLMEALQSRKAAMGRLLAALSPEAAP